MNAFARKETMPRSRPAVGNKKTPAEAIPRAFLFLSRKA